MSSKSKKPKPTPVSEGEKIQTQLAKDQIAYYRGTYAPLEKEFLQTAGTDHSARLAGQNAIASTRESTEGLRSAALSGVPVDTADLASATTLGRVSGLSQGRRERDDGQLEGLGVGLGVTADASKSLSQAASIQTGAAIDATREKMVKMQAKAEVRNAQMAAFGTLVGAGATGYGMKKGADKAAMQQSMRLGGSREGYSSAYLSGWKGPTK